MCFVFFTNCTLVHCSPTGDMYMRVSCINVDAQLVNKEKLQEKTGYVCLLPSDLNRIPVR